MNITRYVFLQFVPVCIAATVSAQAPMDIPPFGVYTAKEKPTWIIGLKAGLGLVQYLDSTETRFISKFTLQPSPSIARFVRHDLAIGVGGDLFGLQMGKDTLFDVPEGGFVFLFGKWMFWQKGTKVAKRPYTLNGYIEPALGLTSLRFIGNGNLEETGRISIPYAGLAVGTNVRVLPRVYLAFELRAAATLTDSGLEVLTRLQRLGLDFIW